MAKKRRKEAEEEKYEFIPPEFDEKQFLTDEMKSSKRVVLVVLYGAIFGVLAGLATAITENGWFGFFMLLIGAAMIRYFLVAIGTDLSKFTKKTWAENGIWYFFTFLAIWVLVINPPFVDYVDPEIKNVKLTIEVGSAMIVYNCSYNYTRGMYVWETGKHNMSVVDAMKSAYQHGTSVNISASVADSSGLNGRPVITIAPNTPQGGEMTAASGSRFYFLIASMSATYLNNGQLFTFSISAGDTHNNRANFDLADFPSAEIQVA
jgi:hypothetical protein